MILQKPLPVAATTLTNACGAGRGLVWRAMQEERSGLRANDFAPAVNLATWIGRVDGLEKQALPPAFAAFDCRNQRLARAGLEQDDFVAKVHRAVTRYGSDRVAVFIGTSTSGIHATELACRDRTSSSTDVPADVMSPAFYECRHSMFAVTRFVRAYLGLTGMATTTSTACSSSAKVFGQAARAIAAGMCDAAVVGGVDSLALSTLYGFHSLGLLSRQPCRPFDADRDGISIGEAAGFALLDPGAETSVSLLGYGESCDAYHMSSPHPEGAGAILAMRAALRSANCAPSTIDYVNLHGTASRVNDAIEDLAVTTVFGTDVPVGSTKGWTGHTLGAAGITEAIVAVMAMENQWLPGTLNCAAVAPEMRSQVVRRGYRARLERVVSNSFGFGGNNCSLVFGRGA